MQKVIDSNFLQDERLREYLKDSNKNIAVITDYACMEAYKGNYAVSVPKSMDIISRYPNQVLVLKGTTAIGALSGRSSGLVRRMVSSKAIQEFKDFCSKLEEIRNGSKRYDPSMAEHSRVASEHLDKMLDDAVGLPATFHDIVKEVFTESEIAIIRKNEPYNREIIRKIIQSTFIMTANLFRSHPHGLRLPRQYDVANTFIFRFSLCAFLLVLRWIEGGRQVGAKSERIRNDMVDVNFASYATYFDGILTSDKKLIGIYEEANYIIRYVKMN
ncbi:hypothetical protein [Methylobacterium sp. WL6]|uniref:hypothetical protein n=1 Tax=Methylobacterium sp. WL6 TaxID=2603901 RepID=UPI0011C76D81|nr:hypothetical protein [Methylobacterium sp. WL6]TXN73433.1 hypothetical protein FV230_01290 [Methylobacterium sp. WL6]